LSSELQETVVAQRIVFAAIRNTVKISKYNIPCYQTAKQTEEKQKLKDEQNRPSLEQQKIALLL